MFHYMLYFTGAVQWEPSVFKLVPSVWTLLRRQSKKRRDERIDAEGRKKDERLRCALRRECESPGARSLALLVSCVIVPLSLLAAEGAALKPRKHEMRGTTGLMFQFHILTRSVHCWITFCVSLNFVRLHSSEGQKSERWRFCPGDYIPVQSFN